MTVYFILKKDMVKSIKIICMFCVTCVESSSVCTRRNPTKSGEIRAMLLSRDQSRGGDRRVWPTPVPEGDWYDQDRCEPDLPSFTSLHGEMSYGEERRRLMAEDDLLSARAHCAQELAPFLSSRPSRRLVRHTGVRRWARDEGWGGRRGKYLNFGLFSCSEAKGLHALLSGDFWRP